jgi:ABC-type multidrug transport system ATPase subunit
VSDALEIHGLVKRFAGRAALDGIDLAVPTGSVFGVLGPNGAGKTTLFSVVAGFLRPDAGTVRVLGLPHRDRAVLRGRIGILPQDATFQRDLSILEQLDYFLRLAGRDPATARREVVEALERVGLQDWLGRRSTELSHGMYKRLCLAQAFLGDPEVVLLDEPTAGLDPANAALVRDLIRTQARRRAAVVVSSHDLAEMQDLCSHVAILAKGRVASVGTMDGVTRATTTARLTVGGIPGDPLLATLRGLPDVVAVAGDGSGIRIEHRGDPTATALAVQAACVAAGAIILRWEAGGTLQEHYRAVTTAPAP